MGLSDRRYTVGPPTYLPSIVKWLLITNIALFVLYFFAVRAGMGSYFEPFALIPAAVVGNFAIWQLFTYMFLHDPMGFGHILFNMLSLWMFGMDLENDWGRERFLRYYLLCGVGAGLCVLLANLLFAGPMEMGARTIGASGAIYGLLLAFGMLYPDRIILFSFLFPLKAKYAVMIFAAIAFLSSIGSSGSGVSHVAHLGGMIFGFFYIRRLRTRRGVVRGPRRSFNPVSTVSGWYKEYKLRRARRKFDVYMRKRESDRDRYTH